MNSISAYWKFRSRFGLFCLAALLGPISYILIFLNSKYTVVCPYCFKSFRHKSTQCPQCKSYFKKGKNDELFQIGKLSETLNPRSSIHEKGKHSRMKKTASKNEEDYDLKIIY
jgi:predicted amidophosphoribosyltransferase